MSPKDRARASRLKQVIMQYNHNGTALPGILTERHLDTLLCQFIDSLRRVEFAQHIRNAKIHPQRMDPSSDIFDPLRAAVLRYRRGEYDEAWWLVFLATHFGKHAVDGWRLARDVYGKLGQGGLWDWATISNNPTAFKTWLAANENILRGADGISRRFSNHRKFESLKTRSKNGTNIIFESYVSWVCPPRAHTDIIRDLHKSVGQNPHAVFNALYKSMNDVKRFGRLGKFDFLTMLGKLGIAPIEPDSPFLKGASGPLAGARLLFAGNRKAALSAKVLEAKLAHFAQATGLGPQVLEDALCNWQKSPTLYMYFKG